MLVKSAQSARSLPASRAARTREYPAFANLVLTASPIPPVAPVKRTVLEISVMCLSSCPTQSRARAECRTGWLELPGASPHDMGSYATRIQIDARKLDSPRLETTVKAEKRSRRLSLQRPRSMSTHHRAPPGFQRPSLQYVSTCGPGRGFDAGDAHLPQSRILQRSSGQRSAPPPRGQPQGPSL